MSTLARFTVLLALSTVLGAGAALADSVTITTVIDLKVGSSSQTITATDEVGFDPSTNKIAFRVGNRSCTLNSSGSPWGAGGGQGCNYSMTFNASTGMISDFSSNGYGCTEASELSTACTRVMGPPR